MKPTLYPVHLEFGRRHWKPPLTACRHSFTLPEMTVSTEPSDVTCAKCREWIKKNPCLPTNGKPN